MNPYPARLPSRLCGIFLSRRLFMCKMNSYIHFKIEYLYKFGLVIAFYGNLVYNQKYNLF